MIYSFYIHKGTHIQASVRRRLIPLFDEKLYEQHLYGLCHFDVRGNDGLYKPTSHSKRLFFKDSTRAFEHDLKMFPVFLRSHWEAIQVGRPRQYWGSDKSSRSIDSVLRDTKLLIDGESASHKFTQLSSVNLISESDETEIGHLKSLKDIFETNSLRCFGYWLK